MRRAALESDIAPGRATMTADLNRPGLDSYESAMETSHLEHADRLGHQPQCAYCHSECGLECVHPVVAVSRLTSQTTA